MRLPRLREHDPFSRLRPSGSPPAPPGALERISAAGKMRVYR